MYNHYERIYPLPNDPAGLVSPKGINNYLVPSGLRQN